MSEQNDSVKSTAVGDVNAPAVTAAATDAVAGVDVLKEVNAMPAPTWSWLKMNKAEVRLPQGLKNISATAVSVEPAEGSERVLRGNAEAFDVEMATADNRYAARARVSAPGDAAQRAKLAAGELGAMDVPALSEYQKGAVHAEEALSVSEAFLTGSGVEAFAYLRGKAGRPVVLDVPNNARARVTVRVDAAAGAISAAGIDVVARRGSALDLVIALDSPNGSPADAPLSEADERKAEVEGPLPKGGADEGLAVTDIAGVAGYALRVFAGRDAKVSITTVQTLDDAFASLEDTGAFLDEGARLTVSHTVLGAGESYTGLAVDLRGDRSRVDIDTSYLGARDQKHDFNYQIRHLGKKTVSNMDANGVLAGASKKVLRGTIDLMHGAKGSEGAERETVLLADDRVENKTVPVILCDEDDVAGNHGATIGHVRPEQLFYLGCRGLSQDEAEALFVSAKLEDAALKAPDDRVRAAVVRLGNAVVPHFEEEIAS